MKKNRFRCKPISTHLAAFAIGAGVAAAALLVGIRWYAGDTSASEVTQQSTTFSIAHPAHVANQDGSATTIGTGDTSWLGAGRTPASSFLGLYFTGGMLPRGAVVTSAQLRFTSAQDQSIAAAAQIGVEAVAAPRDFSRDNPRRKWNSRSLQAVREYTANTRWTAGQSDSSTSVDVTAQLQALQQVSRRAENAPVVLILKGTGSAWGRRFVFNKLDKGPLLVVTYTVPQPTAARPTATPVLPTAVPTVAPTNTLIPSPTGVTGSASPSPAPPSDHDHSSAHGSDSHAMNRWKPNPKYDFCVDRNGRKIGSTEQEASAHIVRVHESFFVIGPDGKKYPTWHPPVYTNPQTGERCMFGHEHGRDPSKSEMWRTKQIQNYFYHDANGNGIMDPAEEAVTGLPFGYVNQQMEVYYKAIGRNVMRHEDHVGHKVDWANGEPDIATHGMSNDPNGGVWIGRLTEGRMLKDTGARCYFLAKPHQGTSTPDAFTNNLHEVFYFVDCRHPDPRYSFKVSLAMMEGFGRPGGFTKFMPLCGIERRSDPQDFVNIGTDDKNNEYPGGDGDREIPTRDCVEKGFLVPEGQWSGNMYEAWPANLSVEGPNGRRIAWGVSLLFDANDANRYYFPEALKAQRGYNNPDAGTNLGFTMDLCYDRSLMSQGRRYRGGPCDWATDYGRIRDITWDDPRSGFRGLNRGMYFQPPVLENAGGPEFWYTDPYGYNASPQPFPGAVRQQVTPKNVNLSTLINDHIDPRVNNRFHDDGGGTVHAPN